MKQECKITKQSSHAKKKEGGNQEPDEPVAPPVIFAEQQGLDVSEIESPVGLSPSVGPATAFKEKKMVIG